MWIVPDRSRSSALIAGRRDMIHSAKREGMATMLVWSVEYSLYVVRMLCWRVAEKEKRYSVAACRLFPIDIDERVIPYVPHHSARQRSTSTLTRTIGARACSQSHIYSNQTEMVYAGLETKDMTNDIVWAFH